MSASKKTKGKINSVHMSDEFLSRLSLYDILSMVIPGGLILFELVSQTQLSANICGCKCNWPFQTLAVLAIVVASYVLGVVHCSIMEAIWEPFRNNYSHISQVRAYVLQCDKEGHFFCSCFVTFALISALACLILLCCGKGEISYLSVWLIFIIYFVIVGFIFYCLGSRAPRRSRERYYKHYESVRKNNGVDYKNIAAIERQVVLLRNLIFPLSGLVFVPCSERDCLAVIRPYILPCCVVVFVATLLRQSKIYHIIYECRRYF